jgi:IMP cyclohydrolase
MPDPRKPAQQVMDWRAEAEANLERHLKKNSYPGRGFVVGRASDGVGWILVYWIMGRSESSRSRRFVVEAATLRTEPTDPARMRHPDREVYEAMLDLPGCHLVGNGEQVRTVWDHVHAGGRFDDALARCEREPDAPNYTPRITALLDLRAAEPALALSILKANPVDPVHTDRFTFRPAPPPAGLGLALTTYQGDGAPLPSFRGEPLLLPLPGGVDDVLELYWDALDASNRVSLAVKSISPGAARIRIRNTHP